MLLLQLCLSTILANVEFSSQFLLGKTQASEPILVTGPSSQLHKGGWVIYMSPRLNSKKEGLTCPEMHKYCHIENRHPVTLSAHARRGLIIRFQATLCHPDISPDISPNTRPSNSCCELADIWASRLIALQPATIAASQQIVHTLAHTLIPLNCTYIYHTEDFTSLFVLTI